MKKNDPKPRSESSEDRTGNLAQRQNQGSPEGLEKQGEIADSRALDLLAELRDHQSCLPRPAALAWERAVFAEAFLDEAPRRRVAAFLRGRD
jgi:hypothetical protein